jgi:hypothetical protein
MHISTHNHWPQIKQIVYSILYLEYKIQIDVIFLEPLGLNQFQHAKRQSPLGSSMELQQIQLFRMFVGALRTQSMSPILEIYYLSY